MNRNALIELIRTSTHKEWDIIVIGGGATGAGIALDAASRGFWTLLLEQDDFGKGTSSRSTKLIHGGVRYLAQGNLILVIEALKERGIILKNAPRLTNNLEFVIPVYTWWEAFKYTVGLKFYDLLAGRLSLGKSYFIGRMEILKRMSNLHTEGLKGGVVYHDGQFDDTRFLIALIRSIIEKGGVALNHCRITGLLKTDVGKICGVTGKDMLSGAEFRFEASVVVNATGVFTDDILRMDQSFMKRTIRPSQGIHIVLEPSFLPDNAAIMIPKTDDGRVLFAIPWHNKVLVGTTDTPVDIISLEPKALDEEIDFILRTAKQYLKVAPERKDILSVFAGLRPLAASYDDPTATREISRRHKVRISASGLVTVEGGKWTTYRRMAQDALDKIMHSGMLVRRTCNTHQLVVENKYYDYQENDMILHPRLPYTRNEIVWICRNEMPQKVEDMLVRRTHALFLDAKASMEMAPEIARIMAGEMGFDAAWEAQQVREYSALVENYLC